MRPRTSASAPPKQTASWAAVLRHPLVVGAGIALISGVFASLLIPALTRGWQDRPKELALKESLVERISGASTDAIEDLVFLGFRRNSSRVEPSTTVAARNASLEHSLRAYLRESSVIGSELTVYFPGTSLPKQWDHYEGAMRRFFDYMGQPIRRDRADAGLSALEDHFRSLKFKRRSDEVWRRDFVSAHPIFARPPSFALPSLLAAERDQIESEIIDSDASGFSHGFWIFG